MAKAMTFVTERIKQQIERTKTIDLALRSQYQVALGDLKFILDSLNGNRIKIKSINSFEKEAPTKENVSKGSNDVQSKLSQENKSKERPKQCTVELKKLGSRKVSKHYLTENSSSSQSRRCTMVLEKHGSPKNVKDDLIENLSSTKNSHRFAAQTIGEQLIQGQSTRLTRLRSQMNLEEKHSKEVSPSAAKIRKLFEKQSPGTNLLDNEIQDFKIENKENSGIHRSKRIVQKQIENFEKLKKDAKKRESEVTGRVTRHARLKAQLKTDPLVRSQVNKRVSSNSAVKIQHTIMVQKQSPEESEMNKHVEQLKRQAKEEVVNKKKEIILKATSEETRRKRERKIQKVAAARKATEQEKNLQAAKAEREKEEKKQHIAAEKEKIKAEKLKKKLQMQQKLQEIEERRKQEEEARMAKLREQEEEHKRILAIKEREMDLQKQQKAAELRLAEAEKAKLHHETTKLYKLAAVNNANATIQAMKPLPTSELKDDYGIDDAKSEDSSEDESRPRKPIPLWAQPKARRRLLVVTSLLPKEIWPLFMECSSDPDINQLFPDVPIKKRTRTSSAVWNTPPMVQRTPR